jgi:SAM-dependent methyltransferase
MPLDPRKLAGRLLRPLTLRLKQSAKENLGRMLLPFRPDLRQRIEAQGLARYRSHLRDDTLAERLVLAALLARHSRRDPQDVARAHRAYWTSEEVVAHHVTLAERFSSAFLGKHFPMVEALETLLDGGRYHTLCEIGCGSGLVLDYFAKRWPALRALIGLDLSNEQTALNKRSYADARLRFVAADASAWIPEEAEAGTVFVTYDGVLQYFTEAALDSLLRALAGRGPIGFAIIEPIASDYDLDNEERSRLFGGEMSFSHNYPLMFARAGFRTRWRRELPEGRYLMMIATLGDDRAYDCDDPSDQTPAISKP